jgi:hypothetical protein
MVSLSPNLSPEPPKRKAYLAGYAGRSVQELLAAAKRLETPANLPGHFVPKWLPSHAPRGQDGQTPDIGAMIVDIRYSARSMQPQWRQASLRTFFRWRYHWIPSLGNVNYRPRDRHKGIFIANYHVGMEDLHLLPPCVPVILLCGCADVATCHRSEVGRELIARGWEVYQLDWEGGAHVPYAE